MASSLLRIAWLAVLAGLVSTVRGQTDDRAATLHESFETPRPSWRQEEADVAFTLQVHDRSPRAAHDGRVAEHLSFRVSGPGSYLYYSYPLPKIPVTETLKASLFVRGNQSGVQLLGRVVLPGDIDPETRQPSFVLIPGGSYDVPERWQRLDLDNIRSSMEQQARVLRLATSRKVSLEGAYLERLVINLHGGLGDSEVFLDDLTISPVPESTILAPPVADARPEQPSRSIPRQTAAGIALQSGRLTREGRDWVPTILDAPGAELRVARPFGCDVLAVDLEDLSTAREAVEQGFLLMPDLNLARNDEPFDPQTVLEQLATYPFKDAVAFWHLGDGLGAANDPERRKEELERVRAIISGLHELPKGTPKLTTATLAGEFGKYALPGRNLDLLGVAPLSWGSSWEPADTYQYLQQRRNLTALSNVQVPYWAWVPAAAPAFARAAVWGEDRPPSWGIPRVQPEQMRIDTYVALMAGYRGIGFRADRDLTKESEKANLYELALLNAEIDLVQSFLARGEDPIVGLQTFPADPKPLLIFNPNMTQGNMTNRQASQNPALGMAQSFPETKPLEGIRAAALGTANARGRIAGRLVLISDASAKGQWQPGQQAANNLHVTVPGAPESCQAFEISLGGVRVLERSRQPGGLRFVVPEFGGTAMVLLTTDLSLFERLKAEVEKVRPRAVDIAIREAQLQLDWASSMHGRLLKHGHEIKKNIKDADDLLYKAQEQLRSAIEAQERQDFEEAWLEARRCTRGLRMLMRAHFEWAGMLFQVFTGVARENSDVKLKKGETRPPIDAQPIASPPMISFSTLPQHYAWLKLIKDALFSRSLVKGGSFDTATLDSLADAGWEDVSYRDDQVKTEIRLEKGGAGRKGQCLKLSASPADEAGIDRVTAFLDHPVVALRCPPIRLPDPPKRPRSNSKPQGTPEYLLARIRVLVKMPRRLPIGAGGLIVRDSAGGEALEYRKTDAIPGWTEAVLFRFVPAGSELSVTLGLAGYGEAYFDDVRIEVLQGLKPSDLDLAADRIRTAQAQARAREATSAGPPSSPTATRRPLR